MSDDERSHDHPNPDVTVIVLVVFHGLLCVGIAVFLHWVFG